MLIHRDALKLEETYNIKLTDTLLTLEDAEKQELLVTIAASHYGLLNGNRVIYRHNTVKDNIGTFISPNPKPIITNHRPKQSKQFGRVIAVDYKLTDWAKEFDGHDFDNMSTEEYIQFCKDELIPFQKKNPRFSGLGYCEVVGKIDDKEGIKNVLNGDFKRVSIGADPIKLVCSHCLKDQMVEMCDHYATKDNDVFFLAEQLSYEELSFLTGAKNPADPGARVTTIHDELQEEKSELDLELDLISAKDFFQIKLADDTKTIVCVDNICKIVNQEEKMARKTEQKPVFNISYADEFTTEELSEIKLADSEETPDLKLTDEVAGELKNSDFAIVQKTEEGTKRRFPIHDEENVKAAVKLFDKAKDLSPSEVLKAKTAITKAAKKFGVECALADAEPEKTEPTITDNKVEENEKTLESVIGDMKEVFSKFDTSKLEDAEVESPVLTVIKEVVALCDAEGSKFNLLDALTSVLEPKELTVASKELVEEAKTQAATITSLTDELAEAKEEIELLDEMNRDLNVEIRRSLIDEIIDSKEQLGILKDSVEDEKAKLVSYPYGILVEKVNEFRELKAGLKDSTVNNKQEVKTVADPTLTDSDDSSKTDAGKLEDGIELPTEEELVALLIKGLKAR